MSKVTRRGYVQSDEKEFSEEFVKVLKRAAEDVYYLIVWMELLEI